MQAYAFDPITSFGMLARPRVCLTIVTLGLPWVPRLSPKENGHLPCINTLLEVLVLSSIVTSASPHIALHQHGCLYSTVKTVSRNDQFLTNNILKHVFLDLLLGFYSWPVKACLRRTFELRYGLPSLLYRPRHVVNAPYLAWRSQLV
jgi:hypothetical protein